MPKHRISPEFYFRLFQQIRMFWFDLAVKDYFEKGQYDYISQLRKLWREEKIPSEYIR